MNTTVTAADLKQIALSIEEGYSFGFFPCYWELKTDDIAKADEFSEDIADMIWQGFYSYHLPCKWELVIGEEPK